MFGGANSDNFDVVFTEYENKFKRHDGNITTTFKTTISSEDVVEIRNISFENSGTVVETIEVSGVFEPVLSQLDVDISHPAFNNLFIDFEKVDDNIIIKRRKRDLKEEDICVGVALYTDNATIGEMEVEIDKSKFLGRNNIGIPKMVEESIPFSNKVGIVIDPIVALRKTIEIEGKSKLNLNLIIAVSQKQEDVLELLKKYKNTEQIKATFELSRAKVEAENRYLGLTSKEIELYQQMLTYLIYKNSTKKLAEGLVIKKVYEQKGLWKYGISGDLPILLLQIKNKNDMDVLVDVVKAYEYFRYKNIYVDLIILNEEENSYEQKLKLEIENVISNRQITYLINNGIYILNNVDDTNKNMLKFRANLIINSRRRKFEDYIKRNKTGLFIDARIYAGGKECIFWCSSRRKYTKCRFKESKIL